MGKDTWASNGQKAVISPSLAQRAERLLRAYANILEAVYSGDTSTRPSSMTTMKGKAREHVPSLVELAARQIGATVEENVRTCLDLDGSGSGESSDGSDGEEMVPSSQGMERSASAQEAQLEASKVQDEWYEACPPSVWRWILAEHATAIVADACGVRVPFPLIEACYHLCLMYRAEQEASRFYRPLLESALYSSPPSGTHVLSLLRTSPSPKHLIDTALLPTLLNSAFSDRLFYHPFLSLGSLPAGMRLRSEEDAGTTVTLLVGLMDVARQMLVAISASASLSVDEDMEANGMDRMVNEVCARLVGQLRAVMPLWMSSPQAASKLESVQVAMDDVLEASNTYSTEDSSSPSARDLVELGVVVELSTSPACFEGRLESLLERVVRLAADDSCSDGSSRASPSEDESPPFDAIDAIAATGSPSSPHLPPTFVKTLARFLCPYRSLADIFQLCENLASRQTDAASGGLGDALVRALLEASLSAKRSQPGAREQVEERLAVFGGRTRGLSRTGTEESASRSSTSPVVANTFVESRPTRTRIAPPMTSASDSTDYDEPVLSQRRAARTAGKRRRRWAVSESPSGDESLVEEAGTRSPSVEVVEPKGFDDSDCSHPRPLSRHLAARQPIRASLPSDADDLDLLHSARRRRRIVDRSAPSWLLSPPIASSVSPSPPLTDSRSPSLPPPDVPRPLSFSTGPPSPSPPLPRDLWTKREKVPSSILRAQKPDKRRSEPDKRPVDSKSARSAPSAGSVKLRQVSYRKEVLARRCWGDISSEDELAM
ncbi:hypothetical protein JCM10908_006289 [Rhodotorula pacifica]|uniref:uncharacterized protein n=1 Tax=Rhodotorula pacifica TaxID=1495444 RepID=UPI0031801161